MDDKYIKDIYDNLGGESVFGNYNDYYSLITSDDSYIKDVYDSKGESVFGSYDDFVSLVKKKEELQPTSQEVVTESITKDETIPGSSDFLEEIDEQPYEYLQDDFQKLDAIESEPYAFESANSIRARIMSRSQRQINPELKQKILSDYNIQKALENEIITEKEIDNAIKGVKPSIKKLKELSIKTPEEYQEIIDKGDLNNPYSYTNKSDLVEFVSNPEDELKKLEAIQAIQSFDAETKKLIDAKPGATEEELDAIFNREGAPTEEQYELAEDDFVPTGFEGSEISNMFDVQSLNKVQGFKIKNFDGYLNEQGYKEEYLRLLEDETISEDGRYHDFSGNYNPSLAAERLKLQYLTNYINKQVERNVESQIVNYQLKNKGRHPSFDGVEISFSSGVDDKQLSEFIEKEFPLITTKLKERDVKNQELYQDMKNGEVKGVGQAFKQGWRSLEDRINSFSAGTYDFIGMDSVADEIRMNQAEIELDREDFMRYTYASGKEKDVDGTTYLVDDKGQVYDKDLGIRVTNVLTPSELQYIQKEVLSKGADGSSFSTAGMVIEGTGIVTDMMFQIAITRGVGNIGRGGSAFLGAFDRGTKAVNFMSKIPMKATTASAMVAQGTLFATNLAEQSYKQALDGGMSIAQAEEIQSIAGSQGLALGVLTAPISTQTYAMDKIFGKNANNVLLKGALEAYEKAGAKGAKAYWIKAGLKAKRYLIETKKEVIQENVQQVGQVYVIGDNVNEFAKKEIMANTISGDEFINTTILSAAAGFFMPFAGDMSSNIKTNYNKRYRPGVAAIDKMKALYELSKDVDKTKQLLNSQVTKRIYTEDQVKRILSDIEVYRKTINNIPPNLSSDTALTVMRDIAEIRKQEELKSQLDPAFHKGIDEKIQDIRNDIIKKTNFDYLSNNSKLKLKDDAIKELSKEAEGRGEKDFVIDDSQATFRAIENFSKLTEEAQKKLEEQSEGKTTQATTEADTEQAVTESRVTPEQETEVDRKSRIDSAPKIFGKSHTDKKLPYGRAVIADITSPDSKGVQTAKYNNPQTGELDVIVSSSGDSANFVGFTRVYENGKPTNRFTAKMESTGDAFKNMITEAENALPDGAEVVETTTISIGGLKTYNKSKTLNEKVDSDGNVVTKTTRYSDATQQSVKEKGNESAFSSFRTDDKTKAEAEVEKIKEAYPGIEVKIKTQGSKRGKKTYTIDIELPVLVKRDAQPAEGVQEVETEVREPAVEEKRKEIEQRKQEELENQIDYIAHNKRQESEGEYDWQRELAKEFNADPRKGLLKSLDNQNSLLKEAIEKNDENLIQYEKTNLNYIQNDLKKYDEISAKYDAELADLKQQTTQATTETDTDTEQAVAETEKVAITPETSSNYANMTEDSDGNFVFFHSGNKGYETVKPMSGDSKATSRAEAAALSKVGGMAMYYTSDRDTERQGADGAKYVVKIPKEKVYDFNNDTNNYLEEAKKRHEKEHPGKAFDLNTQVAYVTKIAGENGFDMVVSEWAGGTRAQTTQELKPVDVKEKDGARITKQFSETYVDNKEKGFESVVPESKQSKFDDLYNEIYKERNKDNKYDDLYFLSEKKGDYTQDEITKLVNESDISQEIKDKYNSILESKEEKRRSVDRKNDSVFTDKTEMPNAPKGVFLDIEMVSGKEGRKMSEQEVLDALPFDTVEVDNDGKNLRIKIPRELSSKEMMSLMKATEQEAIGQVVDGMGVLYAQNEEFRKDYGDKFNPDFFKLPREGKLKEVNKAIANDVSKLREMFKSPSQRKQVDNALNALSEIAPDVEVILHESEQAYAEATGETGRKQKTGGTYDETIVDGKVKKVIHINPNRANKRTVAHETFHAILVNMVKTDAEAQRLTKAMIEAVYKSAPADLKKLIDDFATSKNADGSNNYDSAVQNEEKLAELIGYLATEYDSLPKPTKNVIKRWLDRLAKMFGLKPFTDTEVIDVLNTIAKKVSTGEAITESDVSAISEGVKEITRKRKQAPSRPSISEVRKAARKNIPSATEIVERSEKAIKDKLKKRDFKGTMRYLRKKIFDRQTYIKDILKGVGNKKSVRAHNRLVTKAGAKGFANYRFTKAEKEIYSKLSEKEKKQLDALIYARRIVAINENRKKRGEKEYVGAGGYNYDKAKSEVEAFSNDKLSKRADKYFEVFNQNLKRLRDSGRISEDVYINLRDIEYSPIKTIKYIIGDNHSTSEMNNLANSIGVSQKDIMTLSDENLNDLITDSRWLLMMNINSVENRAATNEVLNLFYDAIESADADGLSAIGENILENPIIGNKESKAPKFKYDKVKVPVGYRTVSFFKNGVEYKMVMREEYARQLLDIKVDDKTLKALRKFTFGNVLRFFATSGNPLFIVGNTAVDFQNILFLGDTYSKFKLVGGVELGFDFVKNSLKKIFNTGNYQKTYEEFMTYGGGMDFLSVDGIKAIKGISRFNKPKTLLQKGMVKWGEGLSYLGETSEMAFRLAVYEKTRSKLINEYKKNNKKEPTGQDLEDILYESARESRETIDFSQGGDLVKSADYVLPYLNASVQGARRAIDYASKNPGGFASNMVQYAVMSGGLIASSLYMLSSAFDDEDDEEEKAKKMKDAWESVSDYEKSAYHIIFTGDVDEDGEYEYYRFKKLPVIGLLSTTVEESIISTYLKSKGVDYEFNTESVSKALDKTSPIGITDIGSRNPAISGVLSYVYNKDTFTGEEIFRGPRGKKILPEAEGILDNKVEQIYKDIAPALGMSPKRTQVMVEKVITNEKTNPLVGVMYGGYNGVFSKETTVGEEMKETMNGVLKSFSGKIKKSTNSKLKEYKNMDEVEKVEAKMETDIYLKEQEIYNQIKDKRKNNEDITSGFLRDVIQEKFERRDWEKYARKFSTYAKNTNIDRSILDLIYEDTPEVQAYKIYSRYGDSLGEDEKKELTNAMRAAKRKLNKKALYIYNQKYRKK